MLSPASGCNLTFGTVKIEDTVDRMKSFHLYIYRCIYNLFLQKKKKGRLGCNVDDQHMKHHDLHWSLKCQGVPATHTHTLQDSLPFPPNHNSAISHISLSRIIEFGHDIFCPLCYSFIHSVEKC